MTSSVSVGVVEQQLTFDHRDVVLQNIVNHTDPTDKTVIEQAIRSIAATGAPFSINDVAPLLPTLVSANSIGPMFGSLAKSGVIRKIGYVPRIGDPANGRDVKLWQATCQRSFMAGQVCCLPVGHDGSHE